MTNKGKPVVTNNKLLLQHEKVDPEKIIPIGSELWFKWLSSNDRFKYIGEIGHLNARKEERSGYLYWYAYRRRNGILYTHYLGKSEDLGIAKLEEACIELSGVPVDQISIKNHPGVGVESNEARFPAPSIFEIEPPVLPTKFVSRPRLTKLITSPLTVIVAPNGYGKTTMINDWRQTCGISVVWITLRTEYNQPLRFWTALANALNNIPELNLEINPYIKMSTPASIPEFLNALTVRMKEHPLGIVLDDYHYITHPKIHSQLQDLIEHVSESSRIILSTRIKPPLALGTLRSQGLLREIDLNDLRFTLEEGMDFIQRHLSNPKLSQVNIETLVHRTNGWVTGLMLIILALNKQENPEEFLASFNGKHTYFREYFTERILGQQPAAVKTFLLKTSILKNLNGDLCDAITQTDGGEEMLSWLWQENLFISRTEEQDWFQYHDLFAEMLQDQLRKEFPNEINNLHRRAADWYYQNNILNDAITHLLSIRAWEEAASIIETVALHELRDLGEDSRLLRWLRQLPESIVQQHRLLLLIFMQLASFSISKEEVENYISNIENNIKNKSKAQQTPDEKEVLDEIVSIRKLMKTGELIPTSFLRRMDNSSSWELISKLSQIINPLFHQTSLDELEQLALNVYRTAEEQGNIFAMILSTGQRARSKIQQGHLNEGESIINHALQQALIKCGKYPETASVPLAYLSLIQYSRNQLENGWQTLMLIQQVDPNPSSSNVPIHTKIIRAKIEWARGEFGECQKTLRIARNIHRRSPSGIWHDQDIMAYEAWFMLRSGDIRTAQQILDEIQEPKLRMMSKFVQASVYNNQGKGDAAEAILRELIHQPVYSIASESRIDLRIQLSIAELKQNKIHTARKSFLEIIRSATSEEIVRPFLDYFESIYDLLLLALEARNLTNDSRAFIKNILSLSGHESFSRRSLSEEFQSLTTAASITEREQEILNLLTDGLQNREIACRLSISESTVKTHLVNIYNKLGVYNRVQALMKAQDLNLVNE